MKLTEILNNPGIMENLRWDLTQEMLDAPGPLRFHPLKDMTGEGVKNIRREHKEQAGYYFCIHASYNKPSLALIHFLPFGDRETEDITGFPEKFLIEAIQQSSGSTRHAKNRIYVGFHIPINKPIEDMLRLRLMIAKKKKEA